jgi:hypothetical protein
MSAFSRSFRAARSASSIPAFSLAFTSFTSATNCAVRASNSAMRTEGVTTDADAATVVVAACGLADTLGAEDGAAPEVAAGMGGGRWPTAEDAVGAAAATGDGAGEGAEAGAGAGAAAGADALTDVAGEPLPAHRITNAQRTVRGSRGEAYGDEARHRGRYPAAGAGAASALGCE